jgi:hypothetical protein
MRTAGGHGGPSIRWGHGVSVGERLVQRHCVCRLVLDDVWVWADRTCTRRGCAPRRPLQEPGRGRTRTAAAAGPGRSQRSMARFAGSSESMRPTTREIGLRQRVPGASNRTRLSGSRVATAEAPGGDADTPGTPVLRYTPDAASGPMFTDRESCPLDPASLAGPQPVTSRALYDDHRRVTSTANRVVASVHTSGPRPS